MCNSKHPSMCIYYQPVRLICISSLVRVFPTRISTGLRQRYPNFSSLLPFVPGNSDYLFHQAASAGHQRWVIVLYSCESGYIPIILTLHGRMVRLFLEYSGPLLPSGYRLSSLNGRVRDQHQETDHHNISPSPMISFGRPGLRLRE